jgi:hypothetical protein
VLLAAAVLAGVVTAVADMPVGIMALAATVVAAAGAAGVLEVARGISRTAGLTVGIELDASRRWVTVRSVHPRFAAAAELTGTHRPSP